MKKVSVVDAKNSLKELSTYIPKGRSRGKQNFKNQINTLNDFLNQQQQLSNDVEEMIVNLVTKHNEFGEVNIYTLDLKSGYMWFKCETPGYSTAGFDSDFAKQCYPTIPMLMRNIIQIQSSEIENNQKLIDKQNFEISKLLKGETK